MAHSQFSFTFFLGINPIEIPRTALSYTPEIKTRMKPVDFTNQITWSFAISQKFLCIGTESHKSLTTARIFGQLWSSFNSGCSWSQMNVKQTMVFYQGNIKICSFTLPGWETRWYWIDLRKICFVAFKGMRVCNRQFFNI